MCQARAYETALRKRRNGKRIRWEHTFQGILMKTQMRQRICQSGASHERYRLHIRLFEAQGVVRGSHKPSDTPSDLQRLASLKARPGPNHLFEGGGEPSRILF